MEIGKQIRIVSYYSPEAVEQLRELADATRIGQAALLREALEDLLRKYTGTLVRAAQPELPWSKSKDDMFERRIVSLNLAPEQGLVESAVWEPPARVARRLPAAARLSGNSREAAFLGLGPAARPDARSLILGTFPSRVSITRNEYYANPRNQFWHIVGRVLGFAHTLPYEDRIRILGANKIALWDVCAQVERPGSLDESIATAVPNDLRTFLTTHKRVERIFLNGKKAEELFRHHVAGPLTREPPEVLPSTSSAHAAMTLDQKIARWSAIKRVPRNV